MIVVIYVHHYNTKIIVSCSLIRKVSFVLLFCSVLPVNSTLLLLCLPVYRMFAIDQCLNVVSFRVVVVDQNGQDV